MIEQIKQLFLLQEIVRLTRENYRDAEIYGNSGLSIGIETPPLISVTPIEAAALDAIKILEISSEGLVGLAELVSENGDNQATWSIEQCRGLVAEAVAVLALIEPDTRNIYQSRRRCAEMLNADYGGTERS